MALFCVALVPLFRAAQSLKALSDNATVTGKRPNASGRLLYNFWAGGRFPTHRDIWLVSLQMPLMLS